MKKFNVRVISWFLALSFLTIGAIKLVKPYNDLYDLQITNSGLGNFEYIVGILVDFLIGLMLFTILVLERKFLSKVDFIVFNFLSCLIAILSMVVVIHVHMDERVSSELLPFHLKIPALPVFYIFVCLVNLYYLVKSAKV